MSVQSTISTRSVNGSATLLRRVLQADTIFSALSGLAFIVGAGPIGRFLGVDAPLVLAALGVGLLLYAAFLGRTAAQAQIDRRAVITAMVLDDLWIVGSIILLLTNWIAFSVAGKWAIGITADIVLVIAILKFIGLRRQ
jgi:hypothetical protein